LSGLAHNCENCLSNKNFFSDICTATLLSKILDADFVQKLSGALLDRDTGRSLHPDIALNLGRLWQKLMMYRKRSRLNVHLIFAYNNPLAGDTVISLTKTDVMSHWHLISIGSFEKHSFNMLSATLKHGLIVFSSPS
jgi:hypothetical protein